MRGRDIADSAAALDTNNTSAPHDHQISDAAAAYSRSNLARIFIGRSEARSLSQVELALLEYNKTNNTCYSILSNLLVRFRNNNKYHLRFINRLADATTINTGTGTTLNSPSSKSTTMAPSCATEQYNVVLQPSESLIIPVNGLSNDNPVKDETSWTKIGDPESGRLERIMEQHALVLTVNDVAHAAWKLQAVKSWLKAVQTDFDEHTLKNSGGGSGQHRIAIKQEPGTAAATGAQSRPPSSSTSVPLPIQTLLAELPRLLESLNDPAALRTLATEIELAGDDDAGNGRGTSGDEQGQQRHEQELLSVIQFTANPPPPAAVVEQAAVKAIPLGTVAAPKIKTEPAQEAATGPTDNAVAKPLGDKNHSKPKQDVPPQQQKSTLPAKNAIDAEKTAAAIAAAERKRKQEIDSAERKRSIDAISLQAQLAHPEDKTLLTNEQKKQKKNSAPSTGELAPLAKIGAKPSSHTTNKPLPTPDQRVDTSKTLARTGTRIIHRQRPPLERPRYLNNINDKGVLVEIIPKKWETVLIRWDGDNIHDCFGEYLVRPIPEPLQAPPPGVGFSSFFDSMHGEVELTTVPPRDEDVDPRARVTCTYFGELNPIITTYGEFPECTVRIPVALPGEETPAVASLENMQVRIVASTVQPSPPIAATTTENTKSLPHPKQQQEQQQKQPTQQPKQKQPTQQQKQVPKNKEARDERGRRRSLSTDYLSVDEDEYDDYSRSRSPSRGRSRGLGRYTRSRSRSYSRSRSRSLPPQRNSLVSSKLRKSPRVYIDPFVDEPNRPHPSYLEKESPSGCVWQLTSSSGIARASERWQEQFFDPVWRYEMRVLMYIYRSNKYYHPIENIFEALPLPHPYPSDFSTFMKFISSRPHLFEILPAGKGKKTAIKWRERASPLLEWKWRFLEFVKQEGANSGYRVPLAEALLACPFPKDTPEEEVELARADPVGYVISILGDALFVLQPNQWLGLPANIRRIYPTVELRPFDSDEIRFPNRCWHGFAKCPLGPTRCGFGHAHPRTFASIPGGLDPGGRSKRH